ncbi:MAG TPA: hypothetical protein VGL53_21740 [Bryobacteraceae bacterium]|jgi:hypothetical protein
MAKAELTKTIEARRLNKRTMRPISNDPFPIPYGAIVDLLQEDGDQMQFMYLGEPYESKADTVTLAVKPLE